MVPHEGFERYGSGRGDGGSRIRILPAIGHSIPFLARRRRASVVAIVHRIGHRSTHRHEPMLAGSIGPIRPLEASGPRRTRLHTPRCRYERRRAFASMSELTGWCPWLPSARFGRSRTGLEDPGGLVCVGCRRPMVPAEAGDHALPRGEGPSVEVFLDARRGQPLLLLACPLSSVRRRWIESRSIAAFSSGAGVASGHAEAHERAAPRGRAPADAVR